MAIADSVRELWRELSAQKVRSALTLLSMAWGTLSLLLLLAFSCGFEALFAERTRGIGDAVAIAWPQRTTKAWQGFPRGRRILVHRDDVLALPAMVSGQQGASAEFTVSEAVRTGAAVHRVTLSGVEPEYASLRSLTPQPGGRFFHAGDVAQRSRVVFLGNEIARSLFGNRAPVGQTLMLRGAPFLVVGVLQPKLQDSDYNGQDSERAFVPATSFLALFGARPITDFVFRAVDARAQAECTAAVVAALGQRLGFAGDDHQALTVWDTTEQQRMLYYIFLGFHVMLGIAGGFTLIVGGLGVAQLMLLLVRRRTAEIGLKLAVGAGPAAIRREIGVQALVLVVLGGGGGVLLSLCAIAVVAASPATAHVGTPYVPPLLAAVTAALLAGIGFLCGVVPARRATRLDPVAALRSA